MVYAGFWKRFAAKLIDSLIVLPIFLINTYFIKPHHPDVSLIVTFILNVLTLFYSIAFIYFLGKTPGKMALGLKVCKTDASKPGLKNSILREVFSLISIALWIGVNFKSKVNIPYINLVYYDVFSYLMIVDCLLYFFNYRRKTLHDYIADTIVVEEQQKQ